MKGLLTEEAACEDLASVLNLVPERSLLCVWTQDSHAEGKSVLLPYAATSDVDMAAPVVPAADRETLIFFQGGCGHPDPAVRPSFTAGKMLRYWLVQELKELGQPDIHVRRGRRRGRAGTPACAHAVCGAFPGTRSRAGVAGPAPAARGRSSWHLVALA